MPSSSTRCLLRGRDEEGKQGREEVRELGRETEGKEGKEGCWMIMMLLMDLKGPVFGWMRSELKSKDGCTMYGVVWCGGNMSGRVLTGMKMDRAKEEGRKVSSDSWRRRMSSLLL